MPAIKIVAALRGLLLPLPLSSLTIVVTGDVAYSGRPDQYGMAKDYFIELKNGLEKEYSIECNLVLCPGNHDCMFPDDTTIRDLVINDIRTKGKLPDSSRMLDECLQTQESFFSWADSLEKMQDRKLAWIREISSNSGGVIAFRVLNSAWMSQIKEKQGCLLFPISYIPTITTGDVRISIMHHPFNWFESSNARELRRNLEAGSDIILTGHEHDIDNYTISHMNSSMTAYIEGGIFSGDSEPSPSLNVVQIETQKSRYKVIQLNWVNDAFIPNSDSEWRPYICSTSAIAREQILTEQTQSFLRDCGLQISNRAKDLTLEDIFVPPELKVYEGFRSSGKFKQSVVQSSNVMNTLIDDKYAYILGEGQCGKTALAKSLFIHLVRRGITPVLLYDANDIVPTRNRIVQGIEKGLRNQYKEYSTNSYWQLEKSKRALIIDNFTTAKLNNDGLNLVLKWIKEQYDYVYIIGGDMTQVEVLVSTPDKVSAFSGFKRYEIRPFGHKLRDVLIKKWVTFGKDFIISQEEASHKIRTASSIINSILGKNLLPANPIYVLIILQQLEASIPQDTSHGSYGYFYESILTMALSRESISPEDLDAKYTYLSELAWYMFKVGVKEIDEESLIEFTRKHVDNYHLTISADRLKEEIIRTRIMNKVYGNYQFIYGCFYYYFIARHLRDNIDESGSMDFIKKASEKLYTEDNANILIFFTYLTKNKTVIRHVLDCTSKLFNDVEPCDLSTHIDFVNRIQKKAPEIVLPDVDPEKERCALLDEMDQAEVDGCEDDNGGIKIRDERNKDAAVNLELINKISHAIQSHQVLGQILRNFSGSLKSDLKTEITKECFDIALRVLNAFYQSLEKDFDLILNAITKIFDGDFGDLPTRKKTEIAKGFIFYLSEIMSFSSLRRISYAVGSEKLSRTYEELERNYNNRALKFVQLSLRLDHFKSFPEKRVRELFHEVKDDPFGLTLLRMIIAEHFHFFPRPYQVRQRICQLLGISYEGTVKIGKS